jgi:hypothetical protein
VTSTDRKTALKRTYKENQPLAGVYKIMNRANGKIFVGKGMNVQGRLNGQLAQLKWGVHRNRALQAEWTRFGADSFDSEVIDYLDPPSDPQADLQRDLTELEALWLNKLQPYGDRGYHDLPKKK